MDEALTLESERLARMWMQHDAAMLRDYLTADVEDPRLNVPSILSRHFLIGTLFGERFQALMDQEMRFAAAMNWLLKLARQSSDAGELQAVRHALELGADNAEGVAIPHFLRQTFAALPAVADGQAIPNYVANFLTGTQREAEPSRLDASRLNTFAAVWRQALAGESPRPLSVLEPACGSANDYRFLEAFGLARLINYTGFDLCEKNVANARTMFPSARFVVGNVFEITATDKAFHLCFTHDLFEHLSPEGLEVAVQEICRVTRQGICVGFFNMDEIPEHRVQPVSEYHWNTLSMERTKDLFARHGFAAQVFHIGSYLRWRIGSEETHNPNAYTFILWSLAPPPT